LHSDPARIDKNVGSALPFDDFRISRHNLYRMRFCLRLHGINDPPQVALQKPFFDNEAAAQIERFCAAHRQIVDRASDGELSDISARKKYGLHNVGVSRKCDASVGKRQRCAIVQHFKRRIVKSREKNSLNQFSRTFAAASMFESDDFVVG
jgi:hypothetical protein